MACSTIVQACLASGRQRPAYTPPEPLEHLHGLDLLELTGSQSKAARALAMHQSTVCRSAALMGEHFRLQPRRGTGVLRYGSNESLELLRLSYRAHSLMDGQLRVATDPLHQPLLAGMVSVQAVPPKFRLSSEWAQLLSQSVIDGALSCSANPILLVPPARGVGPTAAQLVRAGDGAAGGIAAAAVHPCSPCDGGGRSRPGAAAQAGGHPPVA